MATLSRAAFIKFTRINRVCFMKSNEFSRSMLSTAKVDEFEEDKKLKLLSRADYSIADRIALRDTQAPKSPYPLIDSLNIENRERRHHFSVSPEDVIKWIRLGIIDPNIATQYCFYLTDICQSSDNDDHKKYYGKIISALLHMLANRKLPTFIRGRLCAHAANSSSEMCHEVVTKIIDLYGDIAQAKLSDILTGCYKFSLVQEAEELIDKNGPTIITESVVDALLSMIDNHVIHNSTDEKDAAANATIKDNLLKHFVKVVKLLEAKQSPIICKDRDERLLGLKKLGLSITRDVYIKNSGRCTNCNQHVPLYKEQAAGNIHNAIKTKCFDQQSFLKKTSTPEEIERFEKFLEDLYKRDHKPLDLVIDGLNIAFNKSYTYKLDSNAQSNNLKKITRSYDTDALAQKLVNSIIRSDVLSNYRRVLVIGRYSMKNWPGLTFFLNKHNVDVFFLDAKTNDDLFVLYAATRNPKTLFMSNDLMRQHIPVLFPDSEEGKKSMSLWLETHQIFVTSYLNAIRPKPFTKTSHVLTEHKIMHLPVFDHDKYCEFISKGTIQELPGSVFTWLCCRY